MTFTIAHLNLARGYRGGERQTELLIRGLAGKDINQVLIARPNGMLAPRISDLDVEVRPCIGLLSALMATRGTDLVHSHEGRGVYAAFARNLISGTPYVITRRVNNPLKRRWLTRLAYRRAVAVAGVSTEVANIVKRYDERIATCVVHSSSSHLPVDKDNAQSIRSLLPGKWIVGNVSALDNGQKGQEYIIEVAREFSVSHPDVGFMPCYATWRVVSTTWCLPVG